MPDLVTTDPAPGATTPTPEAVSDRLAQVHAARVSDHKAANPPHPNADDPLAVEAARALSIKPEYVLEVVETHRGIEITTHEGSPVVFVIVDPDDPDGAGEYGVMILWSERPVRGYTPVYTPRPDDDERARRLAEEPSR